MSKSTLVWTLAPVRNSNSNWTKWATHPIRYNLIAELASFKGNWTSFIKEGKMASFKGNQTSFIKKVKWPLLMATEHVS